MIILDTIDLSHFSSKPCVLTIGNFDGVHLGHRRILDRMQALAGPKGTLCVVTFSNHPSSVLPGKSPTSLIQSNTLKLSYLEKYGVDVVYNLKFTPELSHIPYDAFLRSIKTQCPFDFLVLGAGDAFGYKREGTPDKVAALGNDMHFQVEYLPKLQNQSETVSSGRIRNCIQQGHLSKAVELLGHPYILEAIDSKPVSPDLCLPPDGDYKVTVVSDSMQKQAVAYLKNKKITLDVPLENKKFSLIFI